MRCYSPLTAQSDLLEPRFWTVSGLPITQKMARPVNASAFIGANISKEDPPRAYWTKAFTMR
jgi:hypothetical protein